MPTYETLTDALTDLRGRGFTYNFNLEPDGLHCPELNLRLHPEHFTIDEQYRFEGMSDPDDNDILYAISSDDGVKGVLVNAYGPYADTLSADMAAKLSPAAKAGS
jgi:hypothetical protein